MNNLTTIESAMQTELLANGLEELIQEFQRTAKAYQIPTSRKDTLALLEQSIAHIRKNDENIESINVDEEIKF